MKLDFKRKTMSLRHGLVRLLAPKTLADSVAYKEINESISCVPRPMTLFLKDYFKHMKSLVCLEIGVAEGINTLNMLQQLPIAKMILVDPYSLYIDEYGLISSYHDCFEKAKDRLSRFQQVTFIKKTSEDAAKDIGEPLDFVYVDGNHSYEHVKKDIELYYPLIKHGGVIGGHDYTPFYCKGLVLAVNEFVQKHNDRLSFYAVFPDWWIIK